MRPYTSKFKINGSPMLVPDAPLQITYADVLSADSGIDESGYMHVIKIRKRVAKWNFVYSSLTEEERIYMESLFQDTDSFRFERPYQTIVSDDLCLRNAFRTSYGIAYYNEVQGLWKNYKFVIQEC